MNKRKPALVALLQEQGFGSRKDCLRLVLAGGVEVGRETGEQVEWRSAGDPEEILSPDGLHIRALGHALPYRSKLYLAFHKPAGTECSHGATEYPSVFGYFPEPFVRRGLQTVGRLDADTTGLLLLSDSGPFVHSLISPRRHVSKVYRVETRHPISADQAEKLRQGVQLRSEPEITLPAQILLKGENLCDMTLVEGKYHQVKRMFAAVGNRVEKIHRLAFGGISLEEGLEAGRWRYLTREELESLPVPAIG